MVPSAPRSFDAVPAALLIAALAAALAGCDPLPPDAIRGPRKIVSGGSGVCAVWDAAPMRCWGSTPYTPAGEMRRLDAWRHIRIDVTPAFARPSTYPDAFDVVFGDGGCVIDRRGALACTDRGAGWPVFHPPFRSAPWMRDVRSPAIMGERICAIARAHGEREESVWCAERNGVSLDALKTGEIGWERLDLGDVAGLAPGPHRLCALLRSGRARCIDLPSGHARDVDGITGAVQLVIGDDFGCARDARGGVRCFGEGADGQLGDGDSGAHADARPVPLSAPATDLAAGYHRACAIVNGAPICWGLLRPRGALPPFLARTPQRVADIDDLGQLALGYDFTCATRKADGTVRCWGYDADGQLGDGSLLPGASCTREGIDGASAERARPGGPTVVRTGDAGPHPRWRVPLALYAALVVLAPLALSLVLARAALRRMAISSRAARIALHGQGVLAALLVPIASSRASLGMLALWDGRYETIRVRASLMGSVALATLGPALALAVATVGFVRLCDARRDQLPAAARRGAAWLVALAGPLLIAAMLVTRDVSERAQTELVYLVRDATLDLDTFFAVRLLASLAWLALAVAYAFFTVEWATKRPTSAANPPSA